MKKLIATFAMFLLLTATGCDGDEKNMTTSSSDVVDISTSVVTTTTVSVATDVTEPTEQTTTAGTYVQTTQQTTAMPQESTATEVTTTTSTASISSTQSTEQVETTITTSSSQKPADTTSATTTVPTESEDAEPQQQSLSQQYQEKLPELEELMKTVADTKTMPAVYVTTYNNERPKSKEVYVEAVIDVFNCDDQYRLTADGGIRVRGNSTADGSEKPYRIKFNKKQNVLGLHDGMEFKSWVLLRSQWNLVADYMGFSLAEEIFNGEYYSSDCTYVNLYINGRYLGLYLLCEQNQAAKGRVDVYEPKKDEMQTDIGYFIEIDNYASEGDDPYFNLDYHGREFTDIEGKTQVFSADDYSIKSEVRNEEQQEFIAKYTDGVFTIMYEAVENNKLLMFDDNYNVVSAEGVYSTPKEAVGAVIDLDSMVNTMILQELVHNYDVGAGSFYMAVDFTEDSKYQRLTFLAPWDFNWGYSEETDGRYYAGAFQKPVHDMWDRSNAWLTVIMKADWFVDMIKEKWAELDNGNALIATIKEVQSTAESLENDLGDDLSWRIDSAKDVVAFVRGRIRWLNTQWG